MLWQEEMPHDAVFHLGIHCFVEKKIDSEIINCDPSIYTMDHPKFLYQNIQKKVFIAT